MAQDPKILEAKFKKAFSDETFAKKIMTLETPQEVQTLLRTKDIDLSVDEIIQVKDIIVEKIAAGGELSDAQLENVSGGGLIAATLLAINLAGIASIALVGALGAAGVTGAVGISAGVGLATYLTRGAW